MRVVLDRQHPKWDGIQTFLHPPRKWGWRTRRKGFRQVHTRVTVATAPTQFLILKVSSIDLKKKLKTGCRHSLLLSVGDVNSSCRLKSSVRDHTPARGIATQQNIDDDQGTPALL